MRRKILISLWCVCVVLVVGGVSFSAIPKKISFQGRLLTSAGAPVSDTNYSITFKIYDASSGGAALWTETQTVATTSGYYNVVLGSTTAITLAFDKDYWISVQVGADAEMSPRFYLGVAGYCINADTLDGVDSSSFVQLTGGNLLVGNPTTTTAKVSAYENGTANYGGYFRIDNATNSNDAVYSATAGTGRAGYFDIDNVSNTSSLIAGHTTGTGNLLQLQKSGVDKFVVTNAGNVLVGNPSFTNAKVSVEETGTTGAAGKFMISNAGSTAQTLAAYTNGTGGAAVYGNTSGAGKAVFGSATGTGNAGYFEISNAANGNPVVYGWTNGTGNAGYFGISNASNGTDALEGQTNGTGSAVYGFSTGTGAALRGNSNGTGNLLQLQKSSVDKVVVTNAGNVLVGNPGTTTAKVSAEETGTTNYAGYFKINNVTSAMHAVMADTTGTGIAVYGYTTGTGKAGYFQIDNASSSAAPIVGNTSGTGNLLQLLQGGVDKVVVTNAGNVLVGNPGVTTAKVGVEETGTANYAGNFQITNASNSYTGIYVRTYGTGGAGVFDIQGAPNTNPALTGNTIGTGKAGSFEIGSASNSSSILFGNTVGTGNLLQLQKSGVDKFVVDNAGIAKLPKNTAQPYACDAVHDGFVALTSGYRLCVCKGGTTTWVFTSDGATSCTW